MQERVVSSRNRRNPRGRQTADEAIFPLRPRQTNTICRPSTLNNHSNPLSETLLGANRLSWWEHRKRPFGRHAASWAWNIWINSPQVGSHGDRVRFPRPARPRSRFGGKASCVLFSTLLTLVAGYSFCIFQNRMITAEPWQAGI